MSAEIMTKLEACYSLLCEIRDRVSGCEHRSIKELFDHELHRDSASAESTYPADKYRVELDRIKGIVHERWGHWADIHGPTQDSQYTGNITCANCQTPHWINVPCPNCGASRFAKDHHDYASGETLENKA
jgi:hypothetical protein